MSAYDIARDMSVGILTYVGATKCVSHIVGDNPYNKTLVWKIMAHILPVRMFEDGFLTSKTITTVATRTVAHETPYVWARDFLEESGFNLTERIPAILGVYKIPGVSYRHGLFATRHVPAVPSHLIHELSLRWMFTLIGDLFDLLVKTIRGLDKVDLAGFLVGVLVLYLWRRYLVLMLSRGWEELNEDVATFVQEHFFPASQELPVDTVTISRADIEDLKTSADAIEKRMNYLRMSKVNFVRGRTGTLFNLNAFCKLQKQLTKAQAALKEEKATKAGPMVKFVRSRRTGVVFNSRTFAKLQKQLVEVQKALEEEKASHKGTKEFLDHQSNARADAEERLEELRASLETEADEEDDNPQLETVEEAGEETPAADQTNSQADLEEGNSNLSTQLEGTEKSEQESATEATNSQPGGEEETPGSNTQLEAIEESEVESLSEHTNAKADLAAGVEDQADKAQVERLQIQLSVEQANYRFVFKKKEIFRQGGKMLKKQLEDLQAEYIELEDNRDTWRQTSEAMENQTDVIAVRALRDQLTSGNAHNEALRDQIASDNAHNERRIEALGTQLRFETTNKEDAQKLVRDLRETIRKLKVELHEAITKYENLQISYEDLDNMHGAEERANEDKSKEISDLKAECDRLEANLTALNERYAGLNAEETGAAEAVAIEENIESLQNGTAILKQPECSIATNAGEGAQLRRIGSDPLFLPVPPRSDNFDPLYDVSDYGDDDRDHEDGSEDGGEDQGHHDDEYGSGNDDGDGPGEDDQDDDDNPVDGRNDGADDVATDAEVAPDADIAQDSHIADSPGLSDAAPSSGLPLNNAQRPVNLPIRQPSPQRAPFNMSGSAPDFVPSVYPKRPVPPLLPHHQAYIASQQGVNSSFSGSGSASTLPRFPTHSAAKSETLSPEASVQGSIHKEYPFPDVDDNTVPRSNDLPEHSPAPKAAGPDEAKNAHIQKLNKEVKRLEWRRKSGMPDLVEDKEGITGPDHILDGMYDRQVTQFLNITPIRCARGSMWGALNDIPNPLENPSIPSTPLSSSFEGGQTTGNGEGGMSETPAEGVQGEVEYGVDLTGGPAMAPEVPVQTNVPASSSVQQSQDGTPREQIAGRQSSTTLSSEAESKADINDEADQASGMDPDSKASKESNDAIEAPKNALIQQASASNSLGAPGADEGPGNEEEWSDLEDEDHDGEEDDDDGPMLGNYKVTRGSTDVHEDTPVPMLGSHKVTRAPAPVEGSSDPPMLGNYKVTRAEAPASNNSRAPKAEGESGADGEWLDVEDGKDEEEANEKDEEDDQGCDTMPVLGSHKVAGGLTPINNNVGMAMLGNDQVTRGLPQQSVTSSPPVLESHSPIPEPSPLAAAATDASRPVAQGHTGGELNPEAASDGQPANRRPSNIFPGAANATRTHDEVVSNALVDYRREHGAKTLAQSMWATEPKADTRPTRQKASSMPTEGVASPRTRHQFGNGPVSRAPPRGPANFSNLPKPQPPPGAPTGPRGHNPGPKRSASQVGTPLESKDRDATPRVRLPAPQSCGIDNQDETPRVRLPPQPKAIRAQPAAVIPETAPSTQSELGDDPNPRVAPFGSRDVRAFDPSSKPLFRGSPLRNELRATPVMKNDGNIQPRTGAWPAATAVASDSRFPRGNGRGGRGDHGGQDGRGAHTPHQQNSAPGSSANASKATPTESEAEDDFKIHGASARTGHGGQGGRGAHQTQQAPAQNSPANRSRAEPTIPVAGIFNQSPGSNVRSHAGRDGYRAGRQQQGLVQASTPNASMAATTSNNDRTPPPAYRNGSQSGQTTPTPYSGSARGSTSANTANSSFQRWQDALAKTAAEEANKK